MLAQLLDIHKQYLKEGIKLTRECFVVKLQRLWKVLDEREFVIGISWKTDFTEEISYAHSTGILQEVYKMKCKEGNGPLF